MNKRAGGERKGRGGGGGGGGRERRIDLSSRTLTGFVRELKHAMKTASCEIHAISTKVPFGSLQLRYIHTQCTTYTQSRTHT